MVFLEKPIDDFIVTSDILTFIVNSFLKKKVVGKNKLESEKNAIIQNKSPVFSKLLKVDQSDAGVEND